MVRQNSKNLAVNAGRFQSTSDHLGTLRIIGLDELCFWIHVLKPLLSLFGFVFVACYIWLLSWYSFSGKKRTNCWK